MTELRGFLIIVNGVSQDVDSTSRSIKVGGKELILNTDNRGGRDPAGSATVVDPRSHF